MLIEVGGAIFHDQRLRDRLACGGSGPRVHEVHRRLHVADGVVPGEADRRRIVCELGDTHFAQGT